MDEWTENELYAAQVEIARLRAQIVDLLSWAEFGAQTVLNDKGADPVWHDEAWYIRERIWTGEFGGLS